MKIVFTGLPYFSRLIVKELNAFDKKNNYFFFNTYYSSKDKVNYFLNLINTSIVVSFNGVYRNSKSLDWAIILKKPIAMFWHGSDVIIAKELFIQNKINLKYINYAAHFTDATWLQNELNEIGIKSQLLPFKIVSPTEKKDPFKNFGAVTYIAQENEKFYGIDYIFALAQEYPTDAFHIIGTNGNDFTPPKNVKFHGWVSKDRVNELLDQYPIFIRLTKHDGYSLSVLEALGNGNEVIWNYPHSQTSMASSKEELIKKYSLLKNKLNFNSLKRNQENITWIKENLNRERILTKFIISITKIV